MNVNAIKITNQPDNDNLQKLKSLSKEFEAIFVEMMLKTMKIGEDSTLGNSAQNSIYQSMYQQALANQIANTSSFGIASSIFNALKKEIENVKTPTIQQPINLKQNNYIPFKLNLPKDIMNVVQKASAMYKVPEKLILSVIKTESNFNPNAVSAKGAAGLMQLMPQTAQSLGVTNVFDPVQNIMAGTKYLSNLIQNLQSVPLALAAYNAGLGNVKKFDGIPPFKETVQYVQKVISYYEKA
ncbi:MAG: transglycosylase SLT domain-containing protein [Desulfurella sp.]|uniref:transglycosylase SLT domain-containing protein n=1 Tax=Desulfurella sp. TaxID=1962857 RepID=UPI003CA02DAF